MYHNFNKSQPTVLGYLVISRFINLKIQTMKKNIKVICTLCLLVFLSCQKEEEQQKIADKTVIVYMAADNNLASQTRTAINRMEQDLPNNDLNLIVYVDRPNESPKILKIKKDQSSQIKSEVIHTFSQQNSASDEVFNKVIHKILKLYPSKSYGLVLWSHSTAWLPETNSLQTRSFGKDKSNEMDIKDLAKVTPNIFDYIIFESCLMGSVEVAYEFKSITPYILAAPTEILAEGMPYHKVTHLFFEDMTIEKRLKTISEVFFKYYNAKENGLQTASISLIKTSELDGLASKTKAVIEKKPLQKWDYKYNELQKLDNFSPTLLYDFLDFFAKNYPENDYLTIKKQLEKTVLYKATTKHFLDRYDIINFSGLSCYVPKQYNTYNDYYKTLNWTKDSGFYLLMDQK